MKRNFITICLLLAVGLFVCFGLITNFASIALAQEELFVSALVEGTEFTASSTGTYRFTIIGGASEVCPPEAQPDYPEWWGWKTEILIYKNRPIDWSGGPHAPEHPNPANWDFSVGDSSLQPTYEQAEEIGKGMFVDISLQENEYVILVVNDSKGYFWDNSGGVYFSISFIAVTETSLTISPPSGDYVTTQAFDVTFIVKAPGLSLVGGDATIDGEHITITHFIFGTLVSGSGVTIRYRGLTGAFLRTGIHTLSATVGLSDGSSVSDTVTWEVIENTEP